jgi:surface polysaccharide O-acyltransferase-like enzyme
VVFVDLARAGAVLFMIQGHTLAVMLETRYDDAPWFPWWLFLRGLTSCLFLLLSGFAFSVVTDRHWDEFLVCSRRVRRRVVRFVFFLALGYLLHFPMGRFAHLPFASDERWRSFLQVDILQVVAVSLLLLQALVAVARTRQRFAVASGALAALAVLATPVTWSLTWTNVMPLSLASFMSAETGSLFPFFPWGAFIFIGALLGMVYNRRWRHRRPIDYVRAFAWSGTALAVLGVALLATPFQPYGEIDVWRASPASFLIRLGAVLVLLAGFAFVSQFITRLPAVLQALAEESLTIYVVHVVVLYGSLWNRGLGQLLGRQDLLHTVFWIGVMFAAMAGLAWIWNRTKQQHPAATWSVRTAVGYYMLRPLI